MQLKFSCSVLPVGSKSHRGHFADAGGSMAEREGRRTANRTQGQAVSRSRCQPRRKLIPLAPRHRHHVVLFKRRQPARGDAFGVV